MSELLKDYKIFQCKEEKNKYNIDMKYNELRLMVYDDGALALCPSDSNSEMFIYIYPSQVPCLLKKIELAKKLVVRERK